MKEIFHCKKGSGNLYDPAIKWTGSKRSQAKLILEHFPKEIDTYYEPFCGGASVLRRLLSSDIKVKHFICSDINSGLIDLWNEIINNPNSVVSHYNKLWCELNKDDDRQRKKEYFSTIRERYNKEHNPLDFMFIMRTTTNGMPRYNQRGEFNNSFHITRNGIEPNKLDKIVNEWSELLKLHCVDFVCCSYDDIKPSNKDFVYLDPPYANTKGMYFGTIDYEQLWNWMRCLPCNYILSFDGISGDVNNTQEIPKDIYSKHEYLLSGNSSFKRTIGSSNNSVVYESIYMK